MSKNEKMCEGDDCQRVASYEIAIPFVNVRTGERGDDWTPCCRRCYPTGERWPTRTLKGHRTLANARFLQAVNQILDKAER